MIAAYQVAIAEIVQSVFATMLNLDVARIEDAPPRSGDALLATIQITGAWMGTVVLELPLPVALAAAAGMLQLSEADVSDADQQDVAAELVNMVGGNLKSLLPGPSYLSLPTIVSGRDMRLEAPSACLLDEVALLSPAGSVHVRLYEHAPESGM